MGLNILFIIVYYFTKYRWIVALKDKTAKNIGCIKKWITMNNILSTMQINNVVILKNIYNELILTWERYSAYNWNFLLSKKPGC